MIPAPFLTRRATRLGIALAVIAGCAGALGWESGETAPPAVTPIAKAPWALGPLKAEDSAKDLAILTELRPWIGFDRPRTAQGAAAAAKAAAKAPWRFAGIVERGEERFALIATGQGRNAKYEYRRVGDSFPDGTIVMQITSDSAKTQGSSSSAEPHVYRLFNKKP